MYIISSSYQITISAAKDDRGTVLVSPFDKYWRNKKPVPVKRLWYNWDMNSNVNKNAESKKRINRDLRIVVTGALFAVQWILILLLLYESVHRIDFMTEKNHALVNMDIICMVVALIFSLSIMRSRRDTVNMYAFLLLIFLIRCIWPPTGCSERLMVTLTIGCGPALRKICI